MFEMMAIQGAFMEHFKVSTPQELAGKVPDGDYIVWVYDEDFNVRVENGVFNRFPEKFNKKKAKVIG